MSGFAGSQSLPGQGCGCEIFDCHPEGFKDNAACRGHRRGPTEDFANFSLNFRARENYIARFVFGALAGSYFDANSALHGFARSSSGTFSEFDAPDAGTGNFQGTRASTNNFEGEVTGWYTDGNNVNHGFVWRP